MLDVDLPEDTALEHVECDNMNRFDRSDRNVRQSPEGFWKRPPQRWSGQEHYHLSHPDRYHHHGKSDLSRGSPYRDSPLGHFESYGGTPFFQAQKVFVDVPENTVVLDEMTLRHMVQDCTAVKAQLLRLKRLLHQPPALQPSSGLPRPTDAAPGKLMKPPHTEDHSEGAGRGARQGAARLGGSFAHGLQQDSSCGLEDLPVSSGLQLAKGVAKSGLSEANLDVTVGVHGPCQLADNHMDGLQAVPASAPALAQPSAVGQAKRAGRNQSSAEDCASQPKSLQLLKPSSLNSVLPPSVSESSPERTPTCKNSTIITPCNSAKHQLTSSQTNLATNLNTRASRLRPPSISFKQKPMSSPQPEPPHFQAKTSIPRPLTKRREIMQNPNGNLNSGDCLASNRYSRLPKPKIH
uniref:Coiled-coil serine rich protein 2 n=1 Tax=Molossus molossus TaxID=27622 RepID=A0A7J8B811_MOLMO|nr:coiled-coil serine rich protein 2 [Molossus molossus]